MQKLAEDAKGPQWTGIVRTGKQSATVQILMSSGRPDDALDPVTAGGRQQLTVRGERDVHGGVADPVDVAHQLPSDSRQMRTLSRGPFGAGHQELPVR